MSEWVQLRDVDPVFLSSPHFVGAHRIGPLTAMLRQLGFVVVDADVTRCATEREVLEVLGAALNYPDYYSPNWDAFDDCLGDLLRGDADPAVLVVLGADALHDRSVHLFTRVVHLLLESAEAVQAAGARFRLEPVFCGDFGTPYGVTNRADL